MKKILLTIALFAFVVNLSIAQISTDAGTFSKPRAKDLLWEINFAPNLTGGNGMFSLPFLAQGSDIVVIKGRKFLEDNKAVRGLANLSFDNDGDATDFTFALGAGIEKHRAGKERLSTYWGYGAAIGYNSDSEVEPGFDNNGNPVELKTTESTFALSMGLFSGFDYYVMPDIYLGVELNYGFGLNSFTPDQGDGVTSFSLAPGVSSFLRLGWKL
jgi:hypothetical protein